MALTTIEKLKLHIGLSLSDGTQDEQLNQFIAQAESIVEGYTHRLFGSAARTEYYRGRGTHELVLDQRPVTSIASIYVDDEGYFGQGTFDSAGLLVVATDYTWKSNGVVFRISNIWPDYNPGAELLVPPQAPGLGNIKVTYTAGYADADVDQRLTFAVNQLIVGMRSASKVGVVITGESLDYYSYSSGPQFPGRDQIQSATKIIGQYRTAVW